MPRDMIPPAMLRSSESSGESGMSWILPKANMMISAEREPPRLASAARLRGLSRLVRNLSITDEKEKVRAEPRAASSPVGTKLPFPSPAIGIQFER